MPRRNRKRRRRSPLWAGLILFGLGVGCLITALILWLWSPDAGSTGTVAATVTAAPARPAPAAAAPVTPAPASPAVAAAGGAEPDEPSAPPDEEAGSPPAAPAAALPTVAPATAAPGGRPRLAIIIDDCGQWPQTERGFVALPFPVTLSVLPHVRYGPAIAREADAAGKGVMLHLPMQTISGRYPGPGTITVTMDDATIRAAVAGDLAELPQARGVNNHEGSRATADRRVMDDVVDVLAQDGRFFIDSRTSPASVAALVAHDHGVPSASRDVFLDNVDDVAAVEAQLREAAAEARAHGSAIAIGHPRPATLLAVRTLAPQLAAAGIDFTLASDLVH